MLRCLWGSAFSSPVSVVCLTLPFSILFLTFIIVLFLWRKTPYILRHRRIRRVNMIPPLIINATKMFNDWWILRNDNKNSYRSKLITWETTTLTKNFNYVNYNEQLCTILMRTMLVVCPLASYFVVLVFFKLSFSLFFGFFPLQILYIRKFIPGGK